MRRMIALLLLTPLLSGCTPSKRPDTDRKQFFTAVRQLPPEPVYDRLRYVHPPQVLPSEEGPDRSLDTLKPILHLEIANSTLERTALALAGMVGYSASTDQSIASRPFSCNISGSADAVGDAIAHQASIQVVLDHERREVRFSPGGAVAPRLLEESNEHQSHN